MLVLVGTLIGCSKKSEVEKPPEDASSAAQAACFSTGDEGSCNQFLQQAYKGSEQDKQRAFAAASTACEQQNAHACLFLAILTEKGEGTAADKAKAAGLYEKACSGGNTEACVSLSGMYEKGEGVLTDPRKSLELLLIACKGSNATGCYLAGLTLLDSDDPSIKQAGLAALRKACDLGDKDACKSARQEAEFQATMASVSAPGPVGDHHQQPDVSSRFVGVEWVVSGGISRAFQLKKVTCQEPFRNHRMCELTISLPEGWEGGMRPVQGRVLDGDGAQTAQWMVGGMLNAEPGRVVRDRFRIDTDTKRVVFEQ